MSAVLACGRGAVISHYTAACWWQLLPYPAQPRPVDITVAGRHPRHRAGIRVHRVTSLDRRDFWFRDAIPITTPAREPSSTSPPSSPPDELDQAFAEAQVRRLVDARGSRTSSSAIRAGPGPGRSAR